MTYYCIVSPYVKFFRQKIDTHWYIVSLDHDLSNDRLPLNEQEYHVSSSLTGPNQLLTGPK